MATLALPRSVPSSGRGGPASTDGLSASREREEASSGNALQASACSRFSDRTLLTLKCLQDLEVFQRMHGLDAAALRRIHAKFNEVDVARARIGAVQAALSPALTRNKRAWWT